MKKSENNTVTSDLLKDTVQELTKSFGDNNLARVNAIIEEFKNTYGINACDEGLNTILHTCMFKGYSHNDVVRALIAAGADVNAHDDLSETPLHKLASNYLKRGNMRNINTIDALGARLLFEAVDNGRAAMTAALIIEGANIEISKCKKGLIPRIAFSNRDDSKKIEYDKIINHILIALRSEPYFPNNNIITKSHQKKKARLVVDFTQNPSILLAIEEAELGNNPEIRGVLERNNLQFFQSLSAVIGGHHLDEIDLAILYRQLSWKKGDLSHIELHKIYDPNITEVEFIVKVQKIIMRRLEMMSIVAVDNLQKAMGLIPVKEVNNLIFNFLYDEKIAESGDIIFRGFLYAEVKPRPVDLMFGSRITRMIRKHIYMASVSIPDVQDVQDARISIVDRVMGTCVEWGEKLYNYIYR
jgi:ankyrin repeat protein